MNLIAENLLYKPDEQFHLNEVSFNFKKGNIDVASYSILDKRIFLKSSVIFIPLD